MATLVHNRSIAETIGIGVSIGESIGMAFGLTIGRNLDAQAEKKNRVLKTK